MEQKNTKRTKLLQDFRSVNLGNFNWYCGGRRGPTSPTANGGDGRPTSPFRESQRDSAPKPRVASPRRYRGYRATIATTPKGLCRGNMRGGSQRVAGSSGMDNAIMGFQYRNPPCAGRTTHSFPRHNHVVVVANLPHTPGVARRTAQPRALGHNVVDVGEGEPWMDASRGAMCEGVDPFSLSDFVVNGLENSAP